MKIHIDINHPAHVHYFKNFIKIMEERGHQFIVTNRDSEIINKLLDAFEIEHITRDKRPSNVTFINSLVYLTKTIFQVFKHTYNKNVDLYLGFASTSCSIVAFFRGKPSILIDDTEHNSLNHFLYKRFCSVVITPFFFKKNLGKKQIRMNAYTEQFYLHSNFFKETNKVEVNEPYIICRFISYDAAHDRGLKGMLTIQQKKALVEELSLKYKVFVSLENAVNNDNDFFEKYKLEIKPEEMHNYIKACALLVSEGATMASEAGVMGVNYLYINPLEVSNVNLQVEKYKNANRALSTDVFDKIKTIDLFSDKDMIRKKIESETLCPTSFLIWFVSNFPESENIMKENPGYQARFKKSDNV